ncbi:FAD:protein FMN transferase [Anaeromicrobium sediminis]|uniref:FAD:protein FMN transferase n=1 Tax=Anaeromicrobium sediminis TaxID=1478221 RepID=A0A267MED0_9FIRM|nr:FAD:protein FMN transferase [Anaeromicrobium sediminis]PAB57235.1 thiamine biosynthesis protein ApbE [Anaeromicrobium sediminis]
MYKRLILLIIGISIIFSGCSKKVEPIKRQTYALGTIIDFTLFEEDEDKANKAIDRAISRINEIEKNMSTNIGESEISSVNKYAGQRRVKVSDDTIYVIKRALEFGKISDGKFDVTILPLIKAWNIGTDKERIPPKEEIEYLIKNIDYKNVEVNDETNEVYLKSKEMGIDLGGIAKGYIGDEVRKIFKEDGIDSAVVSLGGNVTLVGKKIDSSDWKVGVQNPESPRGSHIGVIQAGETNIVTSGNYERYFEKDGKRYHHILDPESGYPAENGVISTTIITIDGVSADALSTSIYLLGLEEGMKLIESLSNVECIIVTEDRNVYSSSGIKGKFNLTDDNFKLGN